MKICYLLALIIVINACTDNCTTCSGSDNNCTSCTNTFSLYIFVGSGSCI